MKFGDFMQIVKLRAGAKELLIKFLDTENMEPTKQLGECGSGDTSTLLMNASIRYLPSGKFHFLRLFFINIAALHVYELQFTDKLVPFPCVFEFIRVFQIVTLLHALLADNDWCKWNNLLCVIHHRMVA